jgi:hypothetical protein
MWGSGTACGVLEFYEAFCDQHRVAFNVENLTMPFLKSDWLISLTDRDMINKLPITLNDIGHYVACLYASFEMLLLYKWRSWLDI